MRVYFQPARQYTVAAGVVEIAPDDVTIKDTLGTTIQSALAVSQDGDGAWYVTTNDALYTTLTKYVLWTTTTTAQGVVTEEHPYWHTTPGTGDITAPDRPSCELASVTTTTAAFNLTAPEDLDFDHYEAVLNVEGSLEETDYPAFTGSVTGLTPGTWYELTVTAVDTSGNRSKPCAAVRFSTLGVSAGDYQFKVSVYMDESVIADAQSEFNIVLDQHRMALGLRGIEALVQIEMVEVGQDLFLLGWLPDAEELTRRADV